MTFARETALKKASFALFAQRSQINVSRSQARRFPPSFVVLAKIQIKTLQHARCGKSFQQWSDPRSRGLWVLENHRDSREVYGPNQSLIFPDRERFRDSAALTPVDVVLITRLGEFADCSQVYSRGRSGVRAASRQIRPVACRHGATKIPIPFPIRIVSNG